MTTQGIRDKEKGKLLIHNNIRIALEQILDNIYYYYNVITTLN